MTLCFKPLLPLAALLLYAGSCFAESLFAVEKNAIEKITSEKVEKITPTRFGGLLEVITDRGIYYTDPGAHFLAVGGSVLDMKTRENLTAQRRNQLDAINFADLPLADAIKTVRGNGSRVLAVFSDVNCAYCKRLEKDLLTLDDTTVYTFMISLMSKESVDQGAAVWCAADRARAWRQVMTADQAPAPVRCDDHPISRNIGLGKKLRLAGTPTIFFPSGERVTGVLPVAAIEARLAKNK